MTCTIGSLLIRLDYWGLVVGVMREPKGFTVFLLVVSIDVSWT